MMAAKTGSDCESDEEFAERTSDELSRFSSGRTLTQLPSWRMNLVKNASIESRRLLSFSGG